MIQIDHLKNSKLQDYWKVKSDLYYAVVQYFLEHSFVNVSTPLLSFPTKEYGDGEFVVFSKLNYAKYYSLPHSPQLYKQYFMAATGGKFYGYFQIAKNFRPEIGDMTHVQEFEQIDFEIHDADLDLIIKTIKDLINIGFNLVGIKPKFTTMTYDAALCKYGLDNPDLRHPCELESEGSEIFFDVPRGDMDEMLFSKKVTISNRLYYRSTNEFFRFFCKKEQKQLLGELRNFLIQEKVIINKKEWSFVIIKHLPVFNKKTNGLSPYHHPQSSPMESDVGLVGSMMDDDLIKLRAKSCEVIINGMEVGGGNVRIDNAVMQKTILEKLGAMDGACRFNYIPLLTLFDSFSDYKSGGAAVGFDRLTMLITGASSLFDVRAFPMTADGSEFFGGPFCFNDCDFVDIGVVNEDPLIRASRQDAMRIVEEAGNFVHDKDHILNVEKNLQLLIQNEKLEPNDVLSLKLAAHWHDVGRTDISRSTKDHEVLSVESFLRWAGDQVPETIIIQVCEIIRSHRYRKNQRVVIDKLARIFWDADKLDILNVERCRKIISYYVANRDRVHVGEFNLFESLLFWYSIRDGFVDKFHTDVGRRLAGKYFCEFRKYVDECYLQYIIKGRKIIALGGAETISGAFKRLDALVLNNLTDKKIILYIPIAIFGNDELLKHLDEYADKLSSYYKKINPLVAFDYIRPGDSEEEIVKKISRAGVLYISGGSTPYLLDCFKKTDIFDAIKNSYDEGRFIIGNSAGILALQEQAVSFDSGNKMIYEGMGLIKDLSILVHFNEKNGYIVEELKRDNPLKTIICLHDSDGAFIVNGIAILSDNF